MKILVTGANGYLGQGIIKQFIDNGHIVVAVDHKTNNIDLRAQIYACDLFEINNPYEYFGKPDAVLHLAWRNGFMHYSDTHINDLPKHFHFLKSLVNAGIKKIVVMGSMHEVGFFEGSIKENTPCHPITPYGISKNTLRELVEMLAIQQSIIYQWLRGYYIVSNSKFGSSIFSKITKTVNKGEKKFPFTMGQNQYDFLDYEMFCYQVMAAVSQEKINGIINICSGKPEKLADRVERFIKDNNYNIELQYGVFPERPYDSKAIWGDDSKIQKILNNNNYLKKGII
jgi:nucleoside-diphosphate-sugar epimerase